MSIEKNTASTAMTPEERLEEWLRVKSMSYQQLEGITVDYIKSLIKKVVYEHESGSLTIKCYVHLNGIAMDGNGIVAEHTFEDCFDEALGREFAYYEALVKLVKYESYHLARSAVNELQTIGYAVKLTRDDASQSYEVSCRDLPELHAVLHDDLCRDDRERHQEIADAIETCAMLYADSGRGMPSPTPALDGEIVVHVPIPKSGSLSPFAAMKTEIQ